MLDFRHWALYGSPMSQTVPGRSHRRGISSAGLFLDDTAAELYCYVSEFGGAPQQARPCRHQSDGRDVHGRRAVATSLHRPHRGQNYAVI